MTLRNALIALTLAALSACREEDVALPDPADMTAEAVGYYCQMNVLEHDGPKAQVHLEGAPAPLFFSQVKDLIAYLHMPEQSHAVVVGYVQDMAGDATWDAPGPWIDARAAVYVLGSDKMGGMEADEFVPFSIEADAQAFVARHGGKLRRYEQIQTDDVLAPDAPVVAGEDDDIAGRLSTLSGQKGTN